ncbi:hypothetical protein ACHHYP_08404 [Achlya hypogyna]|uniref:CLASP N-terminal domain-containing protein n=1 Tax=Achlya hypogyna TaxID=1202772 RepID=A0A1V9YPN0_ACHHY|nr:hypothetical protein ACHHYP_08404 [Achlya hypogyna]
MRSPMQRLKDKMSICERTLLSHHTPAATAVKALAQVGDTVMELHGYGQLDVATCIHDFNLIADAVFLQLDSTNPQVLSAVCELFRALSVCCGEALRPLADAAIVDVLMLCGHSTRSVAFHAKECLQEWTKSTSYALLPIVTTPESKFKSAQESVNFTYHFSVHVPTICENWLPSEISPYHEEIFQLIGNCLQDDNTTIRVQGFKALAALFAFQRQEMKFSATLLAESYLGAIPMHVVNDLLRELPQSLLAKTLAAYIARQNQDRHHATPKYKPQELMYQTPRRQHKTMQSRMLPKESPASMTSYFNAAARQPGQQRTLQTHKPLGESAALHQRRARQPLFGKAESGLNLQAQSSHGRWSTVGKYCRMCGRGCRWIVDQLISRSMQRWIVFWITLISVIFTLVSVVYWLSLATI